MSDRAFVIMRKHLNSSINGVFISCDTKEVERGSIEEKNLVQQDYVEVDLKDCSTCSPKKEKPVKKAAPAKVEKEEDVVVEEAPAPVKSSKKK